MLHRFPTFHKGQRIRVQVEEIPSQRVLLVSLDGMLFRVKNESPQIFKQGDTLDVVVTRTEPLELKFFENYKRVLDRFI